MAESSPSLKRTVRPIVVKVIKKSKNPTSWINDFVGQTLAVDLIRWQDNKTGENGEFMQMPKIPNGGYNGWVDPECVETP